MSDYYRVQGPMDYRRQKILTVLADGPLPLHRIKTRCLNTVPKLTRTRILNGLVTEGLVAQTIGRRRNGAGPPATIYELTEAGKSSLKEK